MNCRPVSDRVLPGIPYEIRQVLKRILVTWVDNVLVVGMARVSLLLWNVEKTTNWLPGLVRGSDTRIYIAAVPSELLVKRVLVCVGDGVLFSFWKVHVRRKTCCIRQQPYQTGESKYLECCTQVARRDDPSLLDNIPNRVHLSANLAVFFLYWLVKWGWSQKASELGKSHITIWCYNNFWHLVARLVFGLCAQGNQILLGAPHRQCKLSLWNMSESGLVFCQSPHNCMQFVYSFYK